MFPFQNLEVYKKAFEIVVKFYDNQNRQNQVVQNTEYTPLNTNGFKMSNGQTNPNPSDNNLHQTHHNKLDNFVLSKCQEPHCIF